MRNRVASSLVITDELLMAYADGELEDGLAQQIRSAIEGDPALAARHEVFRVTGRELGPHFDPVHQSQPPAAMLQAIRSAPISRPLEASRKITFGQSVRNVLQGIGFGPAPWPALAGVAAGLLIGVVSTQWSGLDGALFAERNGKLFAAGALEKTLEGETMAESRESGAYIVTTFKDENGRWCRLYQGPEHAGLACREAEDQWLIISAGEGIAGAETSIVLSTGGEGAKAVDVLATQMQGSSAAGALDTETEAALIARRWKAE